MASRRQEKILQGMEEEDKSDPRDNIKSVQIWGKYYLNAATKVEDNMLL